MLIRILLARTSPINSFVHPIQAFAKQISQLGMQVKFHYGFDKSLADCDVLCIVDRRCHVSRLNRTSLDEVESAKRCRDLAKTVVWFDTSDSTGQTSFELLPYIDLYAKCYLLKDRSVYGSSSYSNSSRLWATYYHEMRGIEDNMKKALKIWNKARGKPPQL